MLSALGLVELQALYRRMATSQPVVFETLKNAVVTSNGPWVIKLLKDVRDIIDDA